MKVQGSGQAQILSPTDQVAFFEACASDRDRALFAVCLFTGCRISEALQLKSEFIAGGYITLTKDTTKGKKQTRQVKVHPSLAAILADYDMPQSGYIFPGRKEGTHLTRFSAEKILKTTAAAAGLAGVSTHSFRRTALTRMNDHGVSLRTIQEISGHQNLAVLARYLGVSEAQKEDALACI